MSDDAKYLISQYQSLWQEQANFRNIWNTTAQYVMPARDNFIGDMTEGMNRNYRIFDSRPIIANERFAAAMEAMLTPRSQIWHKIVTQRQELNDSPSIQRYCDDVNKVLFASRYHPEANFASQTDECYMSLGAFGNNALFVDEVPGRSLRYRSFPMSEVVWAINHQGMVDTLGRKFKYTAKQAVQHWGRENVPLGIQKAYASANPYQELEFLHFIRPVEKYDPFAYGRANKRFECFYVFLGDQSVVEHGGYRSFPCAIGRYRVAPREKYGRGPATTCLPDIRTANEMMKTALRAGQKAVDPPILLAEDGLINNFNQRAGANNYGMVTSEGKPLAMPFESKANWQLGEELQNKIHASIDSGFLNDLWQILVENQRSGEPITATEALIRAQEKGELLAPAMGRQQSEFLGPLIHREIEILEEAGQLPEPPEELRLSGAGLGIEYTSPLARAMRAEEGTAIMNTFTDMATMAQVDPSVTKLLDVHGSLRRMAEIRGFPAKYILSEEQVNELLEHEAQMKQQQDAVTQAPMVSQSVKNLAQAAQAAGAAGGQGAPGASQVPA